MTITTMTVAVCMATTAVSPSPAQQKLLVYMHDRAGACTAIRTPAKAQTAKMFANIGIQIEWRSGEPVNPPSDTRYVVIELVTGTPADRAPKALAFARPYEGVHITVFFDRIQGDASPDKLLAHVMAHEVTHLLQGVSRHSETGVMKARWMGKDLIATALSRCPSRARTSS
jgi:hypothetical protein